MSRLLINEPPLMVLPSLAVKIGLNEAIFVQQLHYLLQMSQNERDGRMWVYNTIDEWMEVMPFIPRRTFERLIKSLKDQGVIISTSEYNKLKMDKTQWYSIDYDALDLLADASRQNGASNPPKWRDGGCQNGGISLRQNGGSNNHKNKTTTKTTSKRVKKNAIDEKFDVVEFLQERNVSDLVIQSFLSHRKKKNADNSPIAMNGFVREAGKAGISLEQALTITIERNWQGFNASWKWQDDAITIGGNQNFSGKPLSKQEQIEAHNQALLNEMYGGSNAN